MPITRSMRRCAGHLIGSVMNVLIEGEASPKEARRALMAALELASASGDLNLCYGKFLLSGIHLTHAQFV